MSLQRLLLCLLVPSALAIQSQRLSSAKETNGACISLESHDSGTYYTMPIEVGSWSKRTVNPVADTGSTEIVIWDKYATNSTTRTGSEYILSYGSGDIRVMKAKDKITIDSNTHNETIYLIEESSSPSFNDIEGIFPLSMEDQNSLHVSKFSMSYEQGSSGALQLGASGSASASATERWELNVDKVGVNGSLTGITSGTALPDSGTTLLLGPINDLETLFQKACSQWSKCGGSSAVDFVNAIEANCSNGAPDIIFTLGGEKVTITGESYVFMWDGECEPAFDYFDYEDNYWILGLPVFFGNEVIFDIDNTKVGFKEGLASCKNSSLAGGRSSVASDGKAKWKINKPPRQPTFTKDRQKLNTVSKARPEAVKLAKVLDARRARLGW